MARAIMNLDFVDWAFRILTVFKPLGGNNGADHIDGVPLSQRLDVCTGAVVQIPAWIVTQQIPARFNA